MNDSFPYTVTTKDGIKTVVAFNVAAEEPVFQTNSLNPSFTRIIEGLNNRDHRVWGLFDVGSSVAARLNEITDRVSWDGRNVLWDGSPVHNTLSEQIMRALRAGNEEDYLAIARFWEKLESNPNEHSRRQAFDWLAAHKFHISPDGDIYGYKGMRLIGDGVYRSTAQSQVKDKPSAYVNGVAVPPLSFVEQKVGDVVMMPRDEVVHDPFKHCSRGLHVSTFSYAKSYGTVALVRVNPRDICSVPNDAGGQKVRVSRYRIERFIDAELDFDSPVHRPGSTWNPVENDLSYRG